MLCREIIAVCSEIHTKHINTLCGQKSELLNVKPGGTYSDPCDLKGYSEHHLWTIIHFSGSMDKYQAVPYKHGVVFRIAGSNTIR